MNIIQVNGLPGSGKTTLATLIAERLNAVHINADWARTHITSHLGFSVEDRIKQAQTLGHLSALVAKTNRVVVDFVSPTEATRQAFIDACGEKVFTIWMNTIASSRFKDTNQLYEWPEKYDLRINRYLSSIEFNKTASQVARILTCVQTEYMIRFNTQAGDSNLKWRIINSETGVEQLASDFEVHGKMYALSSIEYGVQKYNVGVKGVLSWDGTRCIIKAN